MKKEVVFQCLAALAIGFLIAWVVKPKDAINTEPYELKTKIVELEYNNKIQAIESKYLKKLHLIENADSTRLDSLWTAFDF